MNPALAKCCKPYAPSIEVGASHAGGSSDVDFRPGRKGQCVLSIVDRGLLAVHLFSSCPGVRLSIGACHGKSPETASCVGHCPSPSSGG